MKRFHSASSKETKQFASGVAQGILGFPPGKTATVIALSGELGAGKTTFTQGFLRSLGIKRAITSPTFVLMKRYHMPRLKRTFYHLDCYRLKNEQSLATLNFKDIIADPKNILLVEWAERVRLALPKSTIWITFTHGSTEHERMIAMK
jgi:tRNA threonylcarbamoyladenosine biosynthesis protein TsaE